MTASRLRSRLKGALLAMAVLAAACGAAGAYVVYLWGLTPGSLPHEFIRPSEAFYARTAARYRAAAGATRIEVLGYAEDGVKGDSGWRTTCRAELGGTELAQALELWKKLDFDIRHEGMCHDPAYRLRFYSGWRKTLDASVCWDCSNMHPASLYPPLPKMGFDADSAEAQALLKLLLARCQR